MAKKTKLHELLAVEGDLDMTQKKLVDEARDTFGKRADHFIGAHRSLVMFAENDQQQNSEDNKAIVTTVADKLEHVGKAVARYLDAVAGKDHGNQHAAADLEIDGHLLAPGLPATFLLGLESKLKQLRDMYVAIPTLAPGRKWVPDPATGKHVYRDEHPDVKLKTQKTVRHKATEHHPAQIEKWFEDVPVGRITATTWSGMISPAEKADMLERLDRLLRAVKRARMRANMVEVAPVRLGHALLDYIHSGALPVGAGTGTGG